MIGPSQRPQNHEIEQPACLDPLDGPLVQESSHQGQGAPGGGGGGRGKPSENAKPPQRPEGRGPTLGNTKGGLDTAIPSASKARVVGLYRTSR